MNKTIIASLLVAIAAIGSVVVYYANLGKGFKSQTERLVFVRDVRKDSGTELDPSTIVSEDGTHTRLTEVFSPERVGRIENNGDSLLVEFFTMSGSQEISHETVKVSGWSRYRETSSKKMRDLAEEVRDGKFKEAVAKFTGPVLISVTFGIVVDTTEGVSQELRNRVHEVIQELGIVELAKKGHSVALNMYHITESSYQGGRRRIKLKPSNIAGAENWLLSGTEQNSSSVLRGLRSILQEMSQTGGSPRLDIFTDGLENLPGELSVYKNPELQENGNWEKIDKIAHLETLKLKGMEIHLYPLPPRNSRHEEMMEKGLAYLADRLGNAGAKVALESF